MSTVEMTVMIRDKEGKENAFERVDPRKQKVASMKRAAIYEQLIRKEEK